jgi:hypothetical protein
MGSMMMVYSEVARASASGRQVGRVGVEGGGLEEVVAGVCLAAFVEGVVVDLRFLLVTVAHVTGFEAPRGGKAILWVSIESVDEMESWEGGRGRVSTGG